MGACPTHIDVPGFIKRIATGNVRGSARVILEANVLGMSCSRACPVDVLCEGACVMHTFNRKPIQIGLLQRFAMEDFFSRAEGSGAAGISPSRHYTLPRKSPASAEALRLLPVHPSCGSAGYPVAVFDNRASSRAGLRRTAIAEYKLGPPTACAKSR